MLEENKSMEIESWHLTESQTSQNKDNGFWCTNQNRP
jgi:hypothetical protein